MTLIKLNKFKMGTYDARSLNVRLVWYIVNRICFNTSIPFPSSLKCYIIRLLGGSVGVNVIIKPKVSIKCPWLLNLGSDIWIGENVIIDNFSRIHIENDVCISQGVMLITGNHNYQKESFDFMTKDIKIKSNSWIGARAVIPYGVTIGLNSIVSIGSVVHKNLEGNAVYAGNPAVFYKSRN